MTTVLSPWATSPITLDGMLSSPEWTGAGVLPIPAGFLLTKNDNNYLYIALDLVGDTGADVGTGDYFWLSVDTNSNCAITPNVDLNYALYPTLPIRLGRQYYLGPGTWTGLLNTPTTAAVRTGFGPSPNSATAHRIWEMRLPLSELGILNLGIHPDPAVHFGLRVASSNPGFIYDFPAGFYTDFTHLHAIALTRTPSLPPALMGPVIGSVGLIPALAPQISGGYATTAPSYYVFVDEAAFGGTLNLIGNRTTLQNLWTAGARKYRIFLRPVGGAEAPLLQSWQNYRWTGAAYVLESFAWDSNQMYTLRNPALDYSIDDLLIQWNTTGTLGLHELRAEFYLDDAAHTIVPTTPQTLQLMIDNNLPLVDLLQVLHNGNPVSACAMETMTDMSDGVRFRLTVNDLEGHLKDFVLKAYWGAGASATIYSDAYPAHRNAAHQWNGVVGLSVPVGEWVPPVTCAYQFRLSATPRVTNGYSYIGYVEDTYHVTLIKPAMLTAPLHMRRLEPRWPLGQLGEGVPPPAGTVPKKLGGEIL